MLKDRRISFLCGRTKAGRPAEGFLTWLAGEPVQRLALLTDVLRGGGSIEPVPDGRGSSIGDSMKLSSSAGVDEHERPEGATLPNRNGGSWVSAVVGR